MFPLSVAAGRARLARLTLAALLLAVTVAGAADPQLLVTVGEVTDSTAVLWARGQAGTARVQYGLAGQSEQRQAELKLSAGAHLTGKLPLVGLAAGRRYGYAVTQGGVTVRGGFVTAPPPSEATPVKFTWSGDLGSRQSCRHITDGYPIFRTLARFKADFFVFVGDTVYADHVCVGPDRVPGYDFVARALPQYWAKHRYNREEAGVQQYFRDVSVYAIWDDHEVRNDFSGPTERLMPIGRQAFLDYFPIVPPAEEPGRLYRKFRWGSLLELFILDTRQYRSPNSELDGPAKTMLGAAQKRWFIDGVTSSSSTWKIVVSSVSLSLATGSPQARDSWTNATVFGIPAENGTGFAMERDAILREFRERGVKNLIFLVTDVHHAELIRHHPTTEWSFYEFIAGPLSASLGRPRPLDDALGPRSLYALGGIENFGEISVDPSALTVRIIDVTGMVRFTHTMAPE